MEKIVQKPWGYYQVLDRNKDYLIKRIVVYPGQMLSLQKHFHRSEIWLCVKGNATAYLGSPLFYDYIVYYLTPGMSVSISKEQIHRLINPNEKEILVILEYQEGDCREDDIVRYEDEYGREVNELS